MDPDAEMSFDLGLEQRATDRNDGSDLSTETQTVDNTATGSVDYDDQSESDTGEATHTVDPLIPTVESAKNISPERITAGQSANATITGTNGDTDIVELTVSDLNFFTEEISFGGFTGPLTWPANATSAEITYYDLDGNPITPTETVTEGQTPAGPTGDISGFEITYTGPIEPNESGGAAFTIDTTEDATGGVPEASVTNEVTSTATAENGLTDDDLASDDLAIVDPEIDVTLDKTVRPGSAVEPGDTVISSLVADATATGDGAFVDTITVEDVWDESCDGFWNAFDLDSIAPTQVPADTVLTVEVYDGTTWTEIAVYGPEATATTFELDAAALDAALAGAGLTSDDVVGIRFTFTDPAGFPADQTVTPNVVFSARADLRDATCPEPPEDTPVSYTNTATTEADGETAGGRDLVADDDDTDQGTVIYPSGGPGTGPEIDKEWDRPSVDAQSDEQAVTHLDWNIDEGYSPVTITDSAGSPTPVSDTVYDAFDLVRVEPIAASDEPFTTGWYLKYDTVTSVELYDAGADAWVSVPAPGGTWMTADRGFKGYTLTAAEQDSTIGLRITLEETAADTAARQAARVDGPAFDPFAPLPNSGVGSGTTDRRFDLTWQVRDTKRSDPATFVTADELYNTADEAIVDNSALVTGVPTAGGPDATDTDADTIQILDPVPAVVVDKTVTPTQDVYTPPTGTPADEYPTVTWSITGNNASTARASYVRLTDPATCTDTTIDECESAGTAAAAVADPFDPSDDYLTDASRPNPFERFDARSITIGASIADQVDLDATTVWLLRYSGGTYTTEQTTATAVNALGPDDLADVVGISVTFQDTDPAASGGTITQANDLTIVVESRLRATLRSTGEDYVLSAGQTYDQVNRVYAQTYDPVTSDGVVDGDIDDATTQLTGGIVNITPTKSVSPTTITEPEHDAGNDQATVTLGANQGTEPRSTLSPNRVIIEDQADSPEFWDAFDFAGNVVITQMPNGADQVQVDLYDGTTWQEGTPGTPTTFVLPSVPDAQVQGIRFTFSRADGGLFSTTLPAPNWTATATYDVDLRDTYRSSGDEVEFPSTVDNTQSSRSERDVDDNDSDVEDASATVDLDPGTHELAVNKLTNEGDRQALAGDPVPFDLTLENIGTGYLTLTELRDVLPPELVYVNEPAPEYTADPDGSLSEDVTATPSADGSEVVFTWPEDGNVMEPGEVFRIRVYLELQPGLDVGERATNTMVAETDETLDRCANTEAGGTTTDDFATDPTTCGTTDYVGIIDQANLFTRKGVMGSLPGAFAPSDPARTCEATLEATGGSYFRAPCAANSQVGGTDDWVLHNVNAGTVPIDEMVVVDQLPTPGDRELVSGNPRNSAYRPQIVAGSLDVTAPAGTTTTVEVTTSPNVCVGTWTNLQNQPACEQSGETWETAGVGTDWSQVTGIRVRMDFRTSTGGALQDGQIADVTYSSINVLETDTDDTGASRQVPASDQFAWNQYGNKFLYDNAAGFRKLAPNIVGVHLMTGSAQVVKEVTGPAARYAPDEFLVDVTCQVGPGVTGEELDLGADATVELNEANDYTVRIDGIPVSEQGTECTFTEQGDVGEFGETSRTGSPTTVDVTEADDPQVPVEDQDVPTAQVATITNDYQYTGLSVTKRVDTDAVDTEFGPFEFTLSCVSISGEDVVLAPVNQTEITFEIEADETWEAPENRIPVGATCTLAETDADAADDLVFTGDNVVDNGDGTATVTPGVDPAEIEVTNAYDAGTVTLAKETTGDGAARYGTGVFVFDVVCTYQDQTPYDDEVELRDGDTVTIGPYPIGTECAVEETSAGGATDVTLDPADGVVVVPAPADPDEPSSVTLTATNTFDLTSLTVEKVVTGALDAEGANGPFTITAECTWAVDGERVAFDVPGGADRVLRAANDYRGSYRDLPSSARCTLTETDDGGAESTVMVARVAGERTTVDGTEITVDLSETDGPGEAALVVKNRFTDSGTGPGGGGDEGDEGGDGLPGVGARFGPWVVGLAVLLLVVGGAALVLDRRRRS